MPGNCCREAEAAAAQAEAERVAAEAEETARREEAARQREEARLESLRMAEEARQAVRPCSGGRQISSVLIRATPGGGQWSLSTHAERLWLRVLGLGVRASSGLQVLAAYL